MKFAFADVETTGVRVEDKVVEVAWVITDENLNVLEVKNSLINPGIPIPPGASGVHGITNDMVADSPTLDEFMFEHGALFSSPETVFVAHNVPFDIRYLGGFLADRSNWACTLRLARNHLHDVENHKLQTLRYAYQLDSGDAHRAIGDVTTLISFYKWMSDFLNMGALQLAEEGRKPAIVSKLGFGKHKGKKLSDVPPDYRQWLLGLENLDPDLRYSLNLL